MPTTCQFKFARPTPIYYSGEQIIGTITLNSTKRLNVEVLELSLVGTTRVEWLQKCRSPWLAHNDSTESNNKILYSDRRQHLQDTLLLAEGVTLEPCHAYVQQFCFTLPNAPLPATCELEHGEVVYSINLTLQRKYVFSKVFKARVVVKSRLDLSACAELAQPHMLCSNVFQNAANPLQFTLPVTGFVPGQQLPYELCGLAGLKTPTCSSIQLQLWQRCTYRALAPEQQQEQYKHVQKQLAKQTLKVAAESNLVGGQLSIPLVTPISTVREHAATPLIEISYYVQAVLSGRRRVLERLLIPITIGTVAPRRKDVSPVLEITFDHYFCYDNLATALHDDDDDAASIELYDFVQQSDDEVPATPPTPPAAYCPPPLLSRQPAALVMKQTLPADVYSAATFRTLTFYDRVSLLPIEC